MGGVSCVGLFTSGFYQLESPYWQAQSIGQDLVDLFIVFPVLLVSASMAYGNHKMAKNIWAGTNVYLVYTFAIYAFDVHFNSMFFFYCLCLGLSFYSVIYFFYQEPGSVKPNKLLFSRASIITGYYFLLTAILFYFLWLSDILPAIRLGTLPQHLADTGLPTNPVHVIDLSIILPGIFIVGIFLLRKLSIGVVIAPVLLTFTLLMNITIATLNIVMLNRGIETNGIITIVMSVLAIFNIILLLQFRNSASHHPLPHAI